MQRHDIDFLLTYAVIIIDADDFSNARIIRFISMVIQSIKNWQELLMFIIWCVYVFFSSCFSNMCVC